MTTIIYDISFGDFTDDNGALILDVGDYIKTLAENGEDVEVKITETLETCKELGNKGL